MAKISKQMVIALILKYIGGNPQIPNIRSTVESSKIPKYNGFGSLSSFGLGGLDSILGGGSITSVLGDTFQNPLGTIQSTLSSNLDGALSSVSSLTGTITEATLGDLNTALLNLTGNVSNFSNLTSALSGVSPNSFEFGEKTYDFNSAIGSITTLESIKVDIPQNLLSQFSGLSANIDNKVNGILNPLTQQDFISGINTYVANVITSISGAGSPETAALDAINLLNGYTSNVTSLVSGAVTSMDAVQSASEFTQSVGSIAHLLSPENVSNTANIYVNLVVKESTRTSILADMQSYQGFMTPSANVAGD